MFSKIYKRFEWLTEDLENLTREFRSFKALFTQVAGESQRRAESIETWMELAVDTKADEIADRFDELLREHNGKVTNQVLKDLVRQAAKGQ